MGGVKNFSDFNTGDNSNHLQMGVHTSRRARLIMLPTGVFEDSFMKNDSISESTFRMTDGFNERRNSFV